ncbi:hypothetical protein [Flavobacterium foetidum]|uniref:hypothetical protein n=1 Tax=Flavobacterium foetidum TaxID=2026681 RepID=UPI001074BFC5|nr:hypothetical protein [Flavobacterium foetidum]KAF2511231.1 hypothetical protein E0W73_16940 [Flavobacterium foetidum]
MSFTSLTAYDSPVLVGLTIAYGIISAITTLDIRIIQAKKNGTLPYDEPNLPKWVEMLYWLEWLVFIVMVYLNWKYALLVFAIKFILKVLPVLEIIGNFLMMPFKKKQIKSF